MMNRVGWMALAILLGATIVTIIALRRNQSDWTGVPAPAVPVAIDRRVSAPSEQKAAAGFHDITENRVAGFRFVSAREPGGGLLTVYRDSKPMVRLPGARFYLPACDTGHGLDDNVFHVRGRDYLVVGERSADNSLHGVWHVMQVGPGFRYIQGIRTMPHTGCPLFVMPWSGADADVILDVTDTTMCGFDSDTAGCYLSFSIPYSFVRGEFRPDYSTDGTPPDWEYIRQIANSIHLEATPEGKLAPVHFWSVVLELVTEGHAGAATSFVDSVFPGDRPGRKAAMKAFLDRLRTSRHYRGLLRMNRGRMPQ